MIPILYEKNETNFTSNGLGRLADATECLVTEERNGAYELHMEYPIDGIHFSDIAISRIIYAVPADGKGPQPFRIYGISKPLNGIVEVDAEHISYQLSHIPVSPFETTTIGGAMTGLASNAAESCPFTFWTDKSTVADFKVTVPTSIRALLGGSQGSLLDAFGGGEYEFDGYAVKLHSARGNNRGVTLRYGKNITDIKQEENIANTYTGVMPYWQGSDDAGSDVIVTLTEKVLHSANAANFPYQRTIPLDLSSEFESQPTEAQLRTRANSYMTANNIGVPDVDIDVSFIALWQTEEYKDIAILERVNLCDTVTVQFEKLGISATAKVVKTEYNVLLDRYNKIELGDAKRTNLASSIRQDISSNLSSATQSLPTKSYLKKAVDHATQLITGGLGGHVVMTLDANGKPVEILIMDTDDIQTAVNVLRINMNGIGFSTNGYAGPFTSAWTIDGHFVADFIDTGNLNASLITTGTLSANRIEGGVLKMGGASNGNGIIQIYDANNRLLFTIDKDGLLYKSDQTMNIPITEAFRRYGSSGYADQSIYIGIHGIQSFSPSFYDGSVNVGQRGVGLVNGEIRFFDRNSNMFRIKGEPSTQTIIFPRVSFYGGSDSRGTVINSDTSVFGDFSVTGDKNRIFQTKDYGTRKQSAYEMCSPMFGDIGSGIIGEDGLSYVSIDPVFSQTVALDSYFIFIQSGDGSPVFVQEQTKAYFIVRGEPGVKFVWEIKAKQIDGSNKRNEIYFDESPDQTNYDYGEIAMGYISQIKEGRLTA